MESYCLMEGYLMGSYLMGSYLMGRYCLMEGYLRDVGSGLLGVVACGRIGLMGVAPAGGSA